MRIFYSFLIVLVAVLLALLPFSGGIHSLLTDLREDNHTVTTASGTTNATVQLFKSLYDADISSVVVTSHDIDDTPSAYSYNTTTRALVITGLAASTTRIIDVVYDVDAIDNSYFASAITVVTYLWLILIPLFALGSLVWLWWHPVKERLSRA
jgi:hypothetical protein